MRLGLFGGTFDPPHRGHLAVAEAAREAFALDRVLLAPTAYQPLKMDRNTTSFSDRLAMTALLCEGQPGLEPSAIDGPLPNAQPNYTIDTLHRLREQLSPDDTIFVIVGADAFLDLPRWRAPAALLAAAEWIVVSRREVPLPSLPSMQIPGAASARVHVLAAVDVPVSSTAVRDRLLRGETCGEELTSAVLAYIQAHHLYLPSAHATR
jgi:nicotinate-nucleotide adenylyltransferase